MSFEDEDDAFRAFMKVFPDTATVLVDTYDTIAAVKRLARDFGTSVPAVRLDSGDLCELSKEVRQILDQAGMTNTKIFASGDLNEYRIADLISRGAQIDSFGVGTELATSYDAPALSGVYKLASIEENDHVSMRMKLSHEKATYPGAKQVWRFTDGNGKYARDLIGLADEDPPLARSQEFMDSARPLLERVMKDGRTIEGSGHANSDLAVDAREAAFTRLNSARDRAAEERKRLPDNLLALDFEAKYHVSFSSQLEIERDRLERQIKSKHSDLGGTQ
jgi:nicotinate phosphoribosyltransferase